MIAEYERALIAERTRRGKRYRAKSGCASVLAIAPYGYHYIKRTEHSQGHFVVQEAQAEVVRKIFALYAREGWSVAAIADYLTQQGISSRSGRSRWCDSTVLGMLRNPAYHGQAAYGKTQNCPSQKRTRAARQRNGFGRRGSRRPVAQAEWIPVSVPPLIDPETFALAQERLKQNKRLSLRNTKTVSLLQGLLVCGQCGYALCRSGSGVGVRRREYYRCSGADAYRHPEGKTLCSCRSIRVDYLDDLVWRRILELLRTPQIVQAELERRRQSHLSSSPVQQRKVELERELKRASQQMDKLLDAYQEDLLSLTDLRQRAPELKKKIATLEQELQALTLQAVEDQRWIELNQSLDQFLTHLNQTAETMDQTAKQKIVRMLVKQVDVARDTIVIFHSIPVAPLKASSHQMSLLYPSHQSAI